MARWFFNSTLGFFADSYSKCAYFFPFLSVAFTIKTSSEALKKKLLVSGLTLNFIFRQFLNQIFSHKLENLWVNLVNWLWNNNTHSQKSCLKSSRQLFFVHCMIRTNQQIWPFTQNFPCIWRCICVWHRHIDHIKQKHWNSFRCMNDKIQYNTTELRVQWKIPKKMLSFTEHSVDRGLNGGNTR